MIKDTQQLQGFNTIKLPKLKGHVRIDLHNPTTGKTRTYEGDNIVTNAVRDIFANNYLGCVNYTSQLPLWSTWYGGVLCYEQAFPTIEVGGEQVLDPDDYFPQADNVNKLVAHAGQSTIDPSHDDDARRGNPTNLAFEYGLSSVTMVWEWGTTHGNGTIRALALTHKDTGDAGLGSFEVGSSSVTSYAFRNFQPLATLGTLSNPTDTDGILTQYDANHGLWFEIGDTGDYSPLYPYVTGGTNKVRFFIRRLPYNKVGIYETDHADTTYQLTPSAITTSVTFYANPAYYFDFENKRLWLFTNLTSSSVNGTSGYDRSHINYTVIDCENRTELTHGTLTSDVAKLAPLGWAYTQENSKGEMANFNIVKDGDSFYFPTTDGVSIGVGYTLELNTNVTGYQKISTTSSAQETVTLTEVNRKFSSAMYCGGLLIGNGRVVNGTTGYTCLNSIPVQQAEQFPTIAFSTPQKPSSYAVKMGVGFRTSTYLGVEGRYLLANKMLNTTKFNLESAVNKSASEAMTIRYTISEVSENA